MYISKNITFLLSALFLILIPPTSQAANHYPCSKEDTVQVTSAIKYYLDHGNSAISSKQVNILYAQCLDDFASAIVYPKNNETDEAIVYLQKANNQWKVLTLGTDFGDTLTQLNVPKKLQDATEQ